MRRVLGHQSRSGRLLTVCCFARCRPFSIHADREASLQLFLTENKGWGVKAARSFSEGELVVEYVGEASGGWTSRDMHLDFSPNLLRTTPCRTPRMHRSRPRSVDAGQVIDTDSWEKRKKALSRFDHMYFMASLSIRIV